MIEQLRKTTHPNEAVASFAEHTHLVGNLGKENFKLHLLIFMKNNHDKQAYLKRRSRKYDAGKQGLEMKIKDNLLYA